MLRVTAPGLQSSLQGKPRLSTRQYGIPDAGPADSVSMALANRLVGNDPFETALEITFGGFTAAIEANCAIAIAGASDEIIVSDRLASTHQTLHLNAGDELKVQPLATGARTYLAIRSGFRADAIFGSTSTYMPAGFGGLSGRALKAGDVLDPFGEPTFSDTLTTPNTLRPVFTHNFALRACPSAETDLLSPGSRSALFGTTFTVGRQATRMGLALEGRALSLETDGMMKSAPVFPGTVQCTTSGVPIILLCDAQTTGGYPRIANIARCDRHLLGQVRPGDTITLLERSASDAQQDLQDKENLLNAWLNPERAKPALRLA